MNAITEGEDYLLPPDADGVMVSAPSTAIRDLQHQIAQTTAHVDNRETAAARARSSLESRAELRGVAYNELLKVAPRGTRVYIKVGAHRAKQWASLDASSLTRIRSTERRDAALQSIALNMIASSDYDEAFKLRAPALDAVVRPVKEAIEKIETDRLQAIELSRQKNDDDAKLALRLSILDAASMAALATIRERQTETVSKALSEASDPQTRDDLAAARLEAAETISNARGQSSARADSQIEDARPQKSPISEQELSGALRERYIITTAKAGGLFNKGQTEFTHRHGNMEGKAAFQDTGKSLTTTLEDKATIRAMVEVAAAKKWKEVTVSGTDEFRRAAWLEARLNGLDVRGFEPREADLKLLGELKKPDSRENTISQSGSARQNEPKSSVSHGKRPLHVDGDNLTPQQKTVLDTSRAFLLSKEFAPGWTDAAIKELESKLRGERVYVGEVLEHGAAPYKFEDKGAPSYFVTLKTPQGEQTIWGKDLAEAMANETIGKGQSIVLQNTGKRDVVVTEKLFNDAGVQTGTKEKAATRNEWTAQPLALFSEKAKRELDAKSVPRQPTLFAHDPKAPRAPNPVDQDRRAAPQERNQENDRPRPGR